MSTGLNQNFLGEFVDAFNLPEVLGSSTVYAGLAAGKTAYSIADQALYVCTDPTPGNATWSMLASSTPSSTAPGACRIVVGIATSGDTSSDCHFLDSGNGDGLQSAVFALSVLLTYGITGADIQIRSGTINLSIGPQSAFVLPAQCAIRGAGKACTELAVAYDSKFLDMDVNGSVLSGLSVRVTDSNGALPASGSGFVNIVATGTSATGTRGFTVRDVDFILPSGNIYASGSGTSPMNVFSLNVDLTTDPFSPSGNVFENVNVFMSEFTVANLSPYDQNNTAFKLAATRANHFDQNIKVDLRNCHAKNTENGFIGGSVEMRTDNCTYDGSEMGTWVVPPLVQVGLSTSWTGLNSTATSCSAVTGVQSSTGFLVYTETGPDTSLSLLSSFSNCTYRYGGVDLPTGGIGFHMEGANGFEAQGMRITGCTALYATVGFENEAEFDYTQCVGCVAAQCGTAFNDASTGSNFADLVSF